MRVVIHAALLAGLMAVMLGSPGVAAQGWFDLARYEQMKGSDRPMLEFTLAAMYEAVFYAQGSVGRPVICASPKPLPGSHLIEMIDAEIAAPSNPMRPDYTDGDHVAFVLLNALKAEGACK